MSKYITPPTLSTNFSESGKSAKKRFDNILNMKAKKVGVLAFVTVIFIIIMTGCIFKHRQNFGVFECGTLGFSISIPQYWEGKYSTEDDQDSISFYHVGIRQTYGEGTGRLLTIRRLDGNIPEKEAVDTPWPTKYLMQSNDYTYVMEMPSDVQYPVWEGGDRVLANEYVKMADDIAMIQKSIMTISSVGSRTYNSNSKLLFELKDTYTGDAPKVRRIVDLSNFAGIPIQSMELKTDSRPYAITVNFKVENRANYRFFEYSYFNKSAAMMFSLIPNADEINFRIYDNYPSSDYYMPFISTYYNRQKLPERPGMAYFTDEVIRGAVANMESFSDYCDMVSAVNSEAYYNENIKDNSHLTEIYSIIGDDCEITANSGMVLHVTISKELVQNPKLTALLNPKDISLDILIGKNIRFYTSHIRNFKTNQGTSYLFIYDGDSLLYHMDLKSETLDREIINILLPYSEVNANKENEHEKLY